MQTIGVELFVIRAASIAAALSIAQVRYRSKGFGGEKKTHAIPLLPLFAWKVGFGFHLGIMHKSIALHFLGRLPIFIPFLTTLSIRFVRRSRRPSTVQHILISQQPLWDVTVQGIPSIINSLALFEMTIIDMIKPFIPSLQSFTPQPYHPLTEPTPKPTLPIPPNPHSLALLP